MMRRRGLQNRGIVDLNLRNTPGFEINDNATEEEQLAVFGKHPGTGITQHGYTGIDSYVGLASKDMRVSNPNRFVTAPSQVNPTDGGQVVRLSGGGDVLVTRDRVRTGGAELVSGGMGLSSNLLLTMPSADGMWYGRPIWNYSPSEVIDALPAYQANRARLLDPLANFLETRNYDLFIVGIPENNDDATILWKNTYRTQISVKKGSYLTMISGILNSFGKPPLEAAARLQIYDDGAGEYIYDSPLNVLNAMGIGIIGTVTGNGTPKGPFILPSPLAVCEPGLLTIQITNVVSDSRTITGSESEGGLEAYLSLFFAVPKECL